jgi:hypothetical protein
VLAGGGHGSMMGKSGFGGGHSMLGGELLGGFIGADAPDDRGGFAVRLSPRSAGAAP